MACARGGGARGEVREKGKGKRKKEEGRRKKEEGSLDHRQESALVARAAIWQALDALNPRRRAVLVMHEIEGLSVREIASLVGVAAVTVRWHLSRGRRELARRLRPLGDVDGDR